MSGSISAIQRDKTIVVHKAGPVKMMKIRKSECTKASDALRRLERRVQVNSFTGNPAGVNRVGRLTAEAFAPMDFQAEQITSSNPTW